MDAKIYGFTVSVTLDHRKASLVWFCENLNGIITHGDKFVKAGTPSFRSQIKRG